MKCSVGAQLRIPLNRSEKNSRVEVNAARQSAIEEARSLRAVDFMANSQCSIQHQAGPSLLKSIDMRLLDTRILKAAKWLLLRYYGTCKSAMCDVRGGKPHMGL